MSKLLTRWTNWYFSRDAMPYWAVLIFDCCCVVAAGIVGHILMYGLVKTMGIFFPLTGTLCCYLLFYLLGFRLMHTYSGVLRYSSFIDLVRIAFANTLAIALVFITRHLYLIEQHLADLQLIDIDDYLTPLAWEELAITAILATVGMWTSRILVKYTYDVLYTTASAQRTFIYGVREGGVALAKTLRSQRSNFLLAGFVADNERSTTHRLLGERVYLNDEHLPEIMRAKQATVLMVSPLKSDDLRNNQAMIDRLGNAGIKIMIYSQQEWDGKSDIRSSQLKEVDIEDLLPRDQIEVDLEAISKVLAGKCVLITGAAGSIGQEIVRQVATFCPNRLVLVDQAETPLHDMRLFMARHHADIPCETITASICHRIHMEAIFQLYKPEYVFHAAAYKHVPMMEDNPGEAVANNIDGTRIIADLAVKYGTRKFVMISTDKAVNPTNVMGCSKRICEMYCQSLNKAIADGTIKGHTQFVTTRFGNVLGSNGSVIPLFKEQIKAGGPVTVTHPEIIRYFMLIPEACRLVLQAGSMGNGGEIFVFDMGKPVRIADLAKRMINLSGASDVEIKYTGLRDGEKLYEELLNKEENTKPSQHPKIKLASVRELGYHEVNQQVDRLVEITKAGYNDMDIVRQMKVLVPEYKSKNSKYEVLD